MKSATMTSPVPHGSIMGSAKVLYTSGSALLRRIRERRHSVADTTRPVASPNPRVGQSADAYDLLVESDFVKHVHGIIPL